MSQAIHLDFLGTQKRSSVLGWVLLAIGAVMVGWQMLDYSQILQTNSQLRSDLQNTLKRLKISKDDVKRQPPPTLQERAAITQAGTATGQLNYPWDSLLSLIETTQHPDVALLSLDPRSRNGQIRLTAEAKNDVAMMAYVSGLQKNTQLQSALLTTQQLQIQLPGAPLKFQVLAQWKGIQAAPAVTTTADASTGNTSNEKVLP